MKDYTIMLQIAELQGEIIGLLNLQKHIIDQIETLTKQKKELEVQL